MESAESARGKEMFHSLGSSWTGLLPAFRKQSLQLGELEARLLQPRHRRARICRFLGAAGAEVQRQSRSVSTAPTNKIWRRTQDCPWPTKGIPEAATFLFPGSFLNPACSECSNEFSFRPELRFKYSLTRPFTIRPLRPSWQGPCQQKLLVATPGLWSV